MNSPATPAPESRDTTWVGLSDAQADGLACVVCAHDYLVRVPGRSVASRPVGRSYSSSQVMACDGECHDFAATLIAAALDAGPLGPVVVTAGSRPTPRPEPTGFYVLGCIGVAHCVPESAVERAFEVANGWRLVLREDRIPDSVCLACRQPDSVWRYRRPIVTTSDDEPEPAAACECEEWELPSIGHPHSPPYRRDALDLGPFESEPWDLSRIARRRADGSLAVPGEPGATNAAWMVAALEDAGVDLGEFDRFVATYLAHEGWSYVQTVIGWVIRAHFGSVAPPEKRVSA